MNKNIQKVIEENEKEFDEKIEAYLSMETALMLKKHKAYDFDLVLEDILKIID